MANVGRSRLVISTKAGTLRRSRQRSKLRSTDFSPNYIESACGKSISNLNCEYLDIFQLHGIRFADLTEELLRRLQLMKEWGMYRHLGINTHREADMQFVADHRELFDVLLLDVNVCQLDRLPMIEKLHATGIGVLAGTVLGQGHLIKGKIGRIRTFADVWYLARAVLREEGRNLAKYSSAMRETLSSIPGMTPAQAAISFVLGHSPVAACVVGTTQISNLREVLSATSECLPAQSAAAIWRTFEAQRVTLSK